jgi:hypothetical protein
MEPPPPPSRFGPHAKPLAAWVRIQAVTCEQPPQRATQSLARGREFLAKNNRNTVSEAISLPIITRQPPRNKSKRNVQAPGLGENQDVPFSPSGVNIGV